MYNADIIQELVEFINEQSGRANKDQLSLSVQEKYHLTRDGSVFHCEDFAIRFCSSKKRSFGNTVLALSVLQNYDHQPFIVVLVTPEKNYMMLANATFLKKISHSSHELRIDHIRGSFNGSDILRFFEGVSNEPENFEFLYTSHENYTFKENLERLVESTNHIHPIGSKFSPNENEKKIIYESVERAEQFLRSQEYRELKRDLDLRVSAVSSEIANATSIDNVNVRGRMIEYLMTSTKEEKRSIVDALHNQSPFPEIYTADRLGDYDREFEEYITSTDIKTKILFLSSNPKAYNIDKMLSFLSQEKSVYLVYVVAIDEKKKIFTRLCSIYNRQLLSGTRMMKHWAGRNSRGVTQYEGKSLEKLVFDFDPTIDSDAAHAFLKRLLEG